MFKFLIFHNGELVIISCVGHAPINSQSSIGESY